MNKSRGLYLNIILGIYFILVILTLIGLVGYFSTAITTMNTIELVFNFLRSIALVISIAGIFFWKKLAIYLFIVLVIVELISIAIGSMAFDIINLITRVALPALLLFAVSRKWVLFK